MRKFKITYTEKVVVNGKAISCRDKVWIEDNLDRYFDTIDLISNLYRYEVDEYDRVIYEPTNYEETCFPICDGGKKEMGLQNFDGTEFIRTIEWEVYNPNEYVEY